MASSSARQGLLAGREFSQPCDAVFRSARVGGGARRPPDAHDADLSGKDHGFRTVANSVHFSLAAEILIPYSLECGERQGFSPPPS